MVAAPPASKKFYIISVVAGGVTRSMVMSALPAIERHVSSSSEGKMMPMFLSPEPIVDVVDVAVNCLAEPTEYAC